MTCIITIVPIIGQTIRTIRAQATSLSPRARHNGILAMKCSQRNDPISDMEDDTNSLEISNNHKDGLGLVHILN